MHCRCSRCGHRKTLKMPPDHYYRPPKCDICGRKKWRIDKYRRDVERNPKIRACMCHMRAPHLGGLYWFPHRKGSKMCGYNPNLTAEMAEAWARDRGLTA